MNPGVFVNIQQVNVQQPREVNFGLGEQHFKSNQNEDKEVEGSRPNDKFLEGFYNRSVLVPSVLQKIFSQNEEDHKKVDEGSRPNDKFLEGLYNRSFLVPSVLQKIFSLRSSILGKREGDENSLGNSTDSVNTAAIACGESRPCLTQPDNQTIVGSKQLDIDIPSERDTDNNTSSNRDTDIHNTDIFTSLEQDQSQNADNSTYSDENTDSTPSDRNEDIGTTSVGDIDNALEYFYSNGSVDIDNVKDNLELMNVSFTENIDDKVSNIGHKSSTNLSLDTSSITEASDPGMVGFDKKYRSLLNIAMNERDIIENELESQNSDVNGHIKDIDNRTKVALDGCEHMCIYEPGDQVEPDILTQTEKDTPSPDIARVLVVLVKLLAGSRDPVTFILAENLAPARRKWRFVVNEAEVKPFLFLLIMCALNHYGILVWYIDNIFSQFLPSKVTLNVEEMERALKIDSYLLDETNKWDVEEEKKLLLLRCQLLGKCQQGDLQA